MGNTCFINSIFQSLLAIPLLTKYLSNKKEFKLLAEKSKSKMRLSNCLASIVNDEAQNEPIDSI
jgi:ubiquitin C-terminal hydrolase